jgi:hypothetical protein
MKRLILCVALLVGVGCSENYQVTAYGGDFPKVIRLDTKTGEMCAYDVKQGETFVLRGCEVFTREEWKAEMAFEARLRARIYARQQEEESKGE